MTVSPEKRAELLRLAEKCESATGVDSMSADMRTLNADILRAIGWTEDGRDAFDPAGNRALRIPYFVGSLDAAITLVPEEYDWIVGNVNGHYGGTPYACVGSLKEHPGNTAILALVAAALKARAAIAPIEGGKA